MGLVEFKSGLVNNSREGGGNVQRAIVAFGE